ncbi:hypothetical protein HC891_07960 [Candidatus Gracilibacteria bacterium]|nr:hypothetical protein [Candidatus Gracilibacteria bacterium]
MGYGTTSTVADAGLIGRSSVGGTTREDTNGDGNIGSDPPLGNVTADLTVTVNLPGLLSTTINRTTTSTAGTGVYTFTGLPGGASVAESDFDLAFTTPTGYFPTLSDVAAFAPANDSDGAGTGPDQLNTQALGKNSAADRDRGYALPFTVAGTLYFDRDGDNDLVADGEPAIEGVTVELVDASDTVVGSDATDATGAYSIPGASPGISYTVRFVNPDTANFRAAIGTNGSDNDIRTLTGANGVTGAISGTSGGTTSDVDGAFVGRSIVDGVTFEDAEGDGGNTTADDDVVAGVAVTVTLDVAIPNRLTTSYTRTTTSGADGSYTFSDLPGGATGEVSFDLDFTTPNGYNETLADVVAFAPATDSDGTGTAATNSTTRIGVLARRRPATRATLCPQQSPALSTSTATSTTTSSPIASLVSRAGPSNCARALRSFRPPQPRQPVHTPSPVGTPAAMSCVISTPTAAISPMSTARLATMMLTRLSATTASQPPLSRSPVQRGQAPMPRGSASQRLAVPIMKTATAMVNGTASRIPQFQPGRRTGRGR